MRLWSLKPKNIDPDWDIDVEFVKIRSIRVEECSVIRVGDSINWERLDDLAKSFIKLVRPLCLDQFTL